MDDSECPRDHGNEGIDLILLRINTVDGITEEHCRAMDTD